MRKKLDEFLALMKFPREWSDWDMYPVSLFWQQIKLYQPGHEQDSETDRCGAFHWWLRRNPSRDQLERLLRLAALDPDVRLAGDVYKQVRSAKGFDSEMAALAELLFNPQGEPRRAALAV